MSGRDELDAARDRVLDAALLRPGDDVLDLGDGTGLLAADLRERIGDGGIYAIARDVGILEELLRRAHELDVAGVTYLVGDADVLPLPDASVDVAVGQGALSGAVETAGAARELYRVLRPGGRLSLVEEGGRDEVAAALLDAGFIGLTVEATLRSDAAETAVLLTARKP